MGEVNDRTPSKPALRYNKPAHTFSQQRFKQKNEYRMSGTRFYYQAENSVTSLREPQQQVLR